MGSQVKLVLLATSVGEHGISPGLHYFGGVPLINYWVQSLRSCTRLLPVSDKVYVITSPETHGDYLAWASDRVLSAGFPAQNLICTGVSQPSGTPSNALQDLSFALSAEPSLANGYVMVGSLDFFMGVDLPLRPLVEHSVVRGKDTVVFHTPPPGHDMAAHAEVLLDMQATVSVTGAYVNPRIGALDPSPSGQADGTTSTAMAPLVILHRDTLALLPGYAAAEGAATTYGGHPAKQLAAFVRDAVLGAGRAVYGLAIDMAFEVASGAGAEYGDAFMEYFHTEVERVAKQGPAAEALAVVTTMAHETGVISRGDKDVDTLLQSSSQAKRLLLKFDAVAADRIAARAEARRKGPDGFVKFGVRDALPERFADVTTRRHNPRKQHPVYETTANEIGRKPPSQLDMPDVYAGSAGGFSKTFAGPYKARGLVTGITRSKVHKLLDDF